MAARFKHVLIPVDLSDADAAALDMIEQMTGSSTARVTLLHVIEAIDADPDEELQEFYTSLEAKVRSKLADLSQQIAELGMVVNQEILLGQRVAQIVRFAMEHDVDLVVLRSHRVDLSNPGDDWKSVSHQITILSQVPVLLLK